MKNKVHAGVLEVFECRSKFAFVSMANVAYTLGTTPYAIDGHNMGSAKVVNLCTSSIFTSASRGEGPQKGKGLWFELPPDPKNNAELMRAHSFQMLTVGDCTGGKGELTVRFEKKALRDAEEVRPAEEEAWKTMQVVRTRA